MTEHCEGELWLFWQARRALNGANQRSMTTTEARDEIEIIAMHTDWPRLRDACASVLEEAAFTDGVDEAVLNRACGD